MKFGQVKIRSLVALSALVVGFAGLSQAQAATLEFRTSKSLDSTDLTFIRESFKNLVDASEQAENGDLGQDFLPETIAFKIVSQKPSEEMAQILKQAVHASARKIDKAVFVQELEDPNVFTDAYQKVISPMSWNESSPTEDFNASLEPFLERNVQAFSVEYSRGDSISQTIALVDPVTGEVLIFGTRQGI